MLKGIMFRETCCFRGYYGCGLYTAVSSVAYNSIFAFFIRYSKFVELTLIYEV